MGIYCGKSMEENSLIKLRVILVDDEWLMREEMRMLLRDYPIIEIVGEADSVPAAVEVIQQTQPDVIFLDIQMPGETGFKLFERVKINCKVVFVTAYDAYAIKAFEVNAVDYILKPVKRERLNDTIQRLIAQNERLPGQHTNQFGMEDSLYLTVDDRYKFVKIRLIKCVLAEGNYSYIIDQCDKKGLVTKTLKEWEEILPEGDFVRIHRSTIVNVNSIMRIEQMKNYTNLVYIEGIEEPFEMSRRYAARLKSDVKRE